MHFLDFALANPDPSYMRGLPNFKRLRDKPLIGYALAVVAALVAYGVRVWVDPFLPPGFPYLTFFPAVIITAFFCGLGPGILCAVLSGLAAWYFFIPPVDSFELNTSTAVALGFYVFVVTVDIALIHLMTKATARLDEERRLTASLYERQRTMFQELQHRVANNMAFIASLLQLERRQAAAANESTAAFDSAIARIETMSRLHRRLYDPAAADAAVATHFRETVADLIEMAGASQIDSAVNAVDERIDLQRLITLSMLVSELAMNSLKHAFVDRQSGRITVSLNRIDPRQLELIVSDDGRGLQPATNTRGGLGTRIIDGLASQLGGKIVVETSTSGVASRLTFPA